VPFSLRGAQLRLHSLALAFHGVRLLFLLPSQPAVDLVLGIVLALVLRLWAWHIDGLGGYLGFLLADWLAIHQL
jgi:hypothetical protein